MSRSFILALKTEFLNFYASRAGKFIRLPYRLSRKLIPHIKNFTKFRVKRTYTGKDGISWSLNRRLSLDVLLEKNHGVYHAHMDDVLKSCALNSYAIDVGANAGYWTIPMAYYFDKVIAFEANPIEFSRLVKNITLNEKIATKISPYNLAISDSAGLVHLDIRKSIDGDTLLNTGLSSIIQGKSSKSKIQIDSTSLDIMLETRSSAIGLIKIDVEGAEFLVLKGAEEIIVNDKPTIFWEAAYSLDLENSRDNVLNSFLFLQGIGYKSYFINREMQLQLVWEFRQIAELGYDVDVVSVFAEYNSFGW